MPRSWYRKLFPAVLAIGAFLGLIPAAASAADPPDPLDRGSYTVERINPFTAGLATLQEPNGSGGAPGTGSNASVTLQIRGDLYRPSDYSGKSPVIVLVHGNHGSCDDNGDSSLNPPTCDVYKRNDSGYAYLGENLASWGYTVVSLDQDQMMMRQDGFARGMHQRRLLIMALLDALYEANENGLPVNENSNIGDLLKGKLDMTRIGMMGHSR
ncbi:MAG TPA: alpha/beta hydrolase, partial [Solirubrobacterales bacterium]|nr:alpha/beta hydrolase [Solirubrobacterales bacterium]